MNKIIEYMAFGRPIVAFDLLENRRTALNACSYVEPNDEQGFAAAIRELIENSKKRKLMSDYGKNRFVEHLCWENSEKLLLAAYRKLINYRES